MGPDGAKGQSAETCNHAVVIEHGKARRKFALRRAAFPPQESAFVQEPSRSVVLGRELVHRVVSATSF